MNNDDLRYDINDTVNPQDLQPTPLRTPGPVNDGEELWQKLTKRSTLCSRSMVTCSATALVFARTTTIWASQ